MKLIDWITGSLSTWIDNDSIPKEFYNFVGPHYFAVPMAVVLIVAGVVYSRRKQLTIGAMSLVTGMLLLGVSALTYSNDYRFDKYIDADDFMNDTTTPQTYGTIQELFLTGLVAAVVIGFTVYAYRKGAKTVGRSMFVAATMLMLASFAWEGLYTTLRYRSDLDVFSGSMSHWNNLGDDLALVFALFEIAAGLALVIGLFLALRGALRRRTGNNRIAAVA